MFNAWPAVVVCLEKCTSVSAASPNSSPAVWALSAVAGSETGGGLAWAGSWAGSGMGLGLGDRLTYLHVVLSLDLFLPLPGMVPSSSPNGS